MNMQTIGLVRRFDDYGRIVIPKAIREMVNFKVDDPIEICFDEKSVLLRKFNENNNALDKLKNFIDNYSADLPQEAIDCLLTAYDLIETCGEYNDENE